MSAASSSSSSSSKVDTCERWAALSDRAALGDELSRAERTFSRTHVESCEACRAEAEVYEDLGALLSHDPQEIQARREGEAIERRAKTLRRTTRRVLLAGTALSWAAVIALYLRAPPAPPLTPANVSQAPSHALVPPASVSQTPSHLLSEPAPTALSVGAVITARGESPTCVDVPPGVRLCLDPGATMRVRDLGRDRRIDLIAGRAVADLDPQPTGTSFGIHTRDGDAIAIGTKFSVEVPLDDDAAPVVTHVFHGTVLVRSGATHAERAVHANESAVVRNPTPSTSTAAARAPTAADLLGKARERTANGDVAGAIGVYRELQAQHPTSPEAIAALVPFGELQLSRLGDAQSALASFDRYLARSEGRGALEQEASFGRVRALRALGRTAEERFAIETFMKRFPDSAVSVSLRDRLRVIETQAVGP